MREADSAEAFEGSIRGEVAGVKGSDYRAT